MSSLAPPSTGSAPGKGHRRVKSLVRELEQKAPAGSGSPTSPTLGAEGFPPSPVSPTGAGDGQGGSGQKLGAAYPAYPSRRAVSVSYPSNAFAAGGALAGASAGAGAGRTPPAGAHRRKASVASGFGVSPGASTVGAGAAMEGKARTLEEELELEELEELEAMEQESGDSFAPLLASSSNSSPSHSHSSPTQPGSATGMHARQHSRIHERNLSAFFPRPGTGQAAVGYGDTFQDPYGAEASGGVTDLPSAQDDEERPEDKAQKAQRRGHHHRHSMSHSYFSFMDPTAPPNMALMGDLPLSSSTSSTSGAAAAATGLPIPPGTRSKYAYLPYPLRLSLLSLVYLPLSTKLELMLSFAQLATGATLWIQGQAGESLAVTGLGYLVVFDGLGGFARVLVEESGSNGCATVRALMSSAVDGPLRRPYGAARATTLSHFAQAIYLLFSAVYVAKESVEHVLLLHGGGGEDAHGAGHGGMGHGESVGIVVGEFEALISIPYPLLLLAALFSALLSLLLSNHQSLTSAMGPSSFSFSRPRRPGPAGSGPMEKNAETVGNPFTATLLVFALGLVGAGAVIPPAQLAPLDKVLALLEAVAMAYIAYPAAVATGQVLLQTAPDREGGQMVALGNALRDIENHALVTGLEPPHIWQLTAHGASSSAPSTSSQQQPRQLSQQQQGEAATLIVTLHIQVRHSASDADILAVTQYARERCRPALLWGMDDLRTAPSHSSGQDLDMEELGGKGGRGEISVMVRREKEGGQQGGVRFYDHPSMHGAGAGEKEHTSHGGHASHGGHSHEGANGHGHSH